MNPPPKPSLPATRAATAGDDGPRPPALPAAARAPLTPPQKAAVVIYLLNAGGVDPGLSDLPAPVQARVAREIASLGVIDRATLAAVVTEFAQALDGTGRSFPAGLDDVLRQLAPHLSSDVIEQLSAEAELREPALRGPALWAQVASLEDAALLGALAAEGPAIAAAALSRLPAPRAAALLAAMPAERAAAVALGVSDTAEMGSAAMDRIGAAILRQAQADPPRAFADPPASRAGAMLNGAGYELRARLLGALDDGAPEFAAAVRAQLFTFEDIPRRLPRAAVFKVVRAVDRDVLLRALQGAAGPMEPVRDFLLDGVPGKLAAQLRDEMELGEPPTPAAAEEAARAVVDAIRGLEEAGELTLEPAS